MYYIRIFSFTNGLGPEPIWFTDGSRTDATSKMGRFVVIVNVETDLELMQHPRWDALW